MRAIQFPSFFFFFFFFSVWRMLTDESSISGMLNALIRVYMHFRFRLANR